MQDVHYLWPMIEEIIRSYTESSKVWSGVDFV